MNRKSPREKVRQKSICFKSRQVEFMDKYPDFNPHVFCQKALDEQIRPIDKRYLEEEHEEETNE